MGLIEMRLLRRSKETNSFCLVCGTLHRQNHVCVSLFEDEDRLGDVCPQCLSEGPGQAAERALRNGVALVARLERSRRQSRRWKQAEGVRTQVLKLAVKQVGLAQWLGKLSHWVLAPSDLEDGERKAFSQRPYRALLRGVKKMAHHDHFSD